MLEFPIRDQALQLAEEYDTSATMIAEYLLDGYSANQVRHALDVAEACSVSVSETLADLEPENTPVLELPTDEPAPARTKKKASPTKFHRVKPSKEPVVS
jgi:hypothetical protein